MYRIHDLDSIMSESMLTIVKVIVVGVALVNFVGAGKHHHHKSNQPETFDQSQKGDYNIRIHLKDFQIVALLNDGLGDLGVSTQVLGRHT